MNWWKKFEKEGFNTFEMLVQVEQEKSCKSFFKTNEKWPSSIKIFRLYTLINFKTFLTQFINTFQCILYCAFKNDTFFWRKFFYKKMTLSSTSIYFVCLQRKVTWVVFGDRRSMHQYQGIIFSCLSLWTFWKIVLGSKTMRQHFIGLLQNICSNKHHVMNWGWITLLPYTHHSVDRERDFVCKRKISRYTSFQKLRYPAFLSSLLNWAIKV